MWWLAGVGDRRKAQQIVDLHGGEIVERPIALIDLPDNKALVCVVDNGPFEAAGFAFSENEFAAFCYPDGRPREWVLIDWDKACELTGYES